MSSGIYWITTGSTVRLPLGIKYLDRRLDRNLGLWADPRNPQLKKKETYSSAFLGFIQMGIPP